MKEQLIREQRAWRNKDMKVIMVMQRQMSMELRPEPKEPWSKEAIAVYVAAYEGKK